MGRATGPEGESGAGTGDDAEAVSWIDISPQELRFKQLYANHKLLVQEALRQHTATWD